LTWVVRMMCGEKGAFLGSGRGPWTVHVSLRPEDERDVRPGLEDWVLGEGSSSRYAEPDAEGVTPVLRTAVESVYCYNVQIQEVHTHFP
jgi:hypothetical protein